MIAPGSSDKLKQFLELNPEVPKNQIFVDDSKGYAAFKAMSFGSFTDEGQAERAKGVQMKSPDLGGMDGWFSYLGNMASLSPIVEGEEGIPEGVTLLGGTFVVGCNSEEGAHERMLYASADRLPGDYPSPSAVLGEVEKLL